MRSGLSKTGTVRWRHTLKKGEDTKYKLDIGNKVFNMNTHGTLLSNKKKFKFLLPMFYLPWAK